MLPRQGRCATLASVASMHSHLPKAGLRAPHNDVEMKQGEDDRMRRNAKDMKRACAIHFLSQWKVQHHCRCRDVRGRLVTVQTHTCK